ncbi:MAG: NifU family protein [Angelakisella sp.]
MLERIEQVLDEKVRPALRTHDGDIKVVRVEDGVLYFRMLGQCSNCPSAVVTAEELVAPAYSGGDTGAAAGGAGYHRKR